MSTIIRLLGCFLLDFLRPRAALQAELLALRQQLTAFQASGAKPRRLRSSERLFWVWLSRLWPDWKRVLVIVKPETVIRWHREGFRRYWTWKSQKRRPGRPPVSREIRDLIRNMSKSNPTWGAPRIHGELLKLGIEISQTTVAKYMPMGRRPPSQNWRTFLANHAHEIVAGDFFVVPTATFRVLFVFVLMWHERRRVVHFNVTEHPTARWTAQQMVEAFPWDEAPRYLLRDRDGVYGSFFRGRVKGMGIEELLIAPRSPWQNCYVERLIGSIRRDCLDHVVVLGEDHLRRILSSYFDSYHDSRTHLGLAKDTPEPRPVQLPAEGKIVAIPKVGGHHHRYERRAA